MTRFPTKDKTTLIRKSRWISIHCKYVTRRHSLAEYADFAGSDDPEIGLLHYFMYQNKAYAIGQFMRLSYPIFFENEEGKTSYISGYDCTQYYHPLLIEMDDCCERVRLFDEEREVA